MNIALAPAFEPYVDDPVAEHLAVILDEFLEQRPGVLDGPNTKIIRLLAATPTSPVVSTLTERLRELAIRDFEFRFVFAERGLKNPRNHFLLALERARAGTATGEGVLSIIGAPAARKVNESLVLGDRIAWIGGALPDKSAVQTEFGQIIRRDSAVHLAAMGFESVRVGSEPWREAPSRVQLSTSPKSVVQSLFDWRPGVIR